MATVPSSAARFWKTRIKNREAECEMAVTGAIRVERRKRERRGEERDELSCTHRYTHTHTHTSINTSDFILPQ